MKTTMRDETLKSEGNDLSFNPTATLFQQFLLGFPLVPSKPSNEGTTKQQNGKRSYPNKEKR